ncbi:MAG: transketolase family protein [Lachnospiraceae bacterium]|nr:transketolase family protein [Lachnospiraceae bacterium]
MSEIKKIATRVSYGNALAELGEIHKDICVLDADLAASTQTAIFGKRFPDRFFDVGIQEGNMVGVAAGLATTGKTVFCSSFAMFATGRAYEIIRNSVAYPRLNVKICASHAGVSVGEDGATHQCIEDIALMRVLPNMLVIQPADDVEARQAVKAAYEHKGPVYLRLARLASPVFNSEDYKFEVGKGVMLRDGCDVTLLATGLPVTATLEAAEMLAGYGIRARVINIHTIKPLDTDIIVKAAKETGRIVTIEEHSVIGGFGSAVCEALSGIAPVPVCRIGIQDQFGVSGPALDLYKMYGLDAEGICKQVRSFMEQKF